MSRVITWGGGTYGGGMYGGGSPPLGASKKAISVGLYCVLAIDEATGDLELPIRLLRGPEGIAQKVRSCLRSFKGEWFLDQRLGIDYFRYVFIKGYNPVVVTSLIRNALRKVRGVANVGRVSLAVDRSARTGAVDFAAKLDDGSTLTAKNEPFVVVPG